MILRLASLVVTTALAAQTTPPVPTTAKANLKDALSGGKKWKADAVLIQITASRVGPDGKHISWEYGFFSPSAKGCAVVYVARGQTAAQPSGDASCQAPALEDTFMDSDQAMAAARKGGITAPLARMAVSTERNKPTWTVMDNGGVAKGEVILELDATTGAVVDKITQR